MVVALREVSQDAQHFRSVQIIRKRLDDPRRRLGPATFHKSGNRYHLLRSSNASCTLASEKSIGDR